MIENSRQKVSSWLIIEHYSSIVSKNKTKKLMLFASEYFHSPFGLNDMVRKEKIKIRVSHQTTDLVIE